MRITLTIIQLNVSHLTILVIDGQHHGVDESLIRSQIQAVLAV